ncbi:Fic family protein [Paenibacillus hexagrammi]|uniref:Fic family protein n=1 Tax=Paenibacillus hexagrammi TaxID=2908839 RepID=A0ABY3SHQ8_9BACL|nr:Fic family protein [Paenibacillus sp. YPD9-1]UJF33577.1 Fic family protein [Paenibacillus sp. YPD9-1]
MYELLSKLYYKDPGTYSFEFERRINSYGTIKLPFSIKPFKSNEEFSCFYVNHAKLDLMHDQILHQSRRIRLIADQLPEIAIDQYIRAKLIDELLSTNEIEGVRSTKAEMEIVLEVVIRNENSKKKNVRHFSLMKSYVSLLSEKHSFLTSVEQVREIYDHLVRQEMKAEDHLDGKVFRKQPVDVVTATGKVIHKGVYPESSIYNYLKHMIEYLNEHPTPMLYKIAISHYLFGYIHPFYDGNGRTSRYISSMYLLSELDRLTALTLSYSTNKHRNLYYDAFSESNHPHNQGELTFFCEAFFEIIHKAQNDILVELSEKQIKIKQLEQLISVLPIEDEICSKILFYLGQNYIFGISGKGLLKKELEAISGDSSYVISKAVEVLKDRSLIEVLRKRPLEITLSGSLRATLED